MQLNKDIKTFIWHLNKNKSFINKNAHSLNCVQVAHKDEVSVF